MKKLPIHWILVLIALVCAALVGTCAVRTEIQIHETRESMDRSQLSMQKTQQEIVDIQTKREEAQKKARQEALDAKKAQEAEEAQKAAEKKEQEAQEPETTPAPETTPEETNDEEDADSFPATSNDKIVGIDPGHQGSWVDMSAMEANAPGSSEMKARCTTGTTGNYTGLEEYQLNLDVSLKLKEILQERGYQVVMTREDNDANISNAERAQKVTNAGADIYVRVHANSSDDTSVAGALTMCPSQSNPYVGNLYDESYRLSQCVLDSYCAATGFGNRGVTLTDTMTGINWSTVPVTIIEMGFMSNQGDDTTMADSDFQNTMAEGIANGIDVYFGQE